MVLIIIAVVIGLVAGWFCPFIIPASLTPYVAVAILAAADTVIGGIVAEMTDRFNTKMFASGFFTNAALAIVIIAMGKKLGIDLTLAAVVIFGTRIFNNFSTIRHHILQNGKKRGKIRIINENGQVSAENVEHAFKDSQGEQ